MAKKDDTKKDKQYVDFVSQDKDWRGVIHNELRCQEAWHKDWGFLADDTGNYIILKDLKLPKNH
jgi:hypothetical protein